MGLQTRASKPQRCNFIQDPRADTVMLLSSIQQDLQKP